MVTSPRIVNSVCRTTVAEDPPREAQGGVRAGSVDKSKQDATGQSEKKGLRPLKGAEWRAGRPALTAGFKKGRFAYPPSTTAQTRFPPACRMEASHPISLAANCNFV